MRFSQKLRLSGGEPVCFSRFRRRVTHNREISMPGPSCGGDPRRGEIACQRGRCGFPEHQGAGSRLSLNPARQSRNLPLPVDHLRPHCLVEPRFTMFRPSRRALRVLGIGSYQRSERRAAGSRGDACREQARPQTSRLPGADRDRKSRRQSNKARVSEHGHDRGVQGA